MSDESLPRFNGNPGRDTYVKNPFDIGYEVDLDKETVDVVSLTARRANHSLREAIKNKSTGVVENTSLPTAKEALLTQAENAARLEDVLRDVQFFSRDNSLSEEDRLELDRGLEAFIGNYQKLLELVTRLRDRQKALQVKHAVERRAPHAENESLRDKANRYVASFFEGQATGNLPAQSRLEIVNGVLRLKYYDKTTVSDIPVEEYKVFSGRGSDIRLDSTTAVGRLFPNTGAVRDALTPLCGAAVESVLVASAAEPDRLLVQSQVENAIARTVGDYLWCIQEAHQSKTAEVKLEKPNVPGLITGVLLSTEQPPQGRAKALNLRASHYLPRSMRELSPERRQALIDEVNPILVSLDKPPLTLASFETLFCEHDERLVAAFEQIVDANGNLNLGDVKENLKRVLDLEDRLIPMRQAIKGITGTVHHERDPQVEEKRRELEKKRVSAQNHETALLRKCGVSTLAQVKWSLFSRGISREDVKEARELEDELQGLSQQITDLESNNAPVAAESRAEDIAANKRMLETEVQKLQDRERQIRFDVFPKQNADSTFAQGLPVELRRVFPDSVPLEPYATFLERFLAATDENLQQFANELSDETRAAMRLFLINPEKMKECLNELKIKDSEVKRVVVAFIAGRLSKQPGINLAYSATPALEIYATGRLLKGRESNPRMSVLDVSSEYAGPQQVESILPAFAPSN